MPDVFMNKQRLVWEPSVRTNCWLIWRGLEPSPFKVAHRSAPKEEWYLGFKMKSRGSICHAWTCVSIFYQALGSTLFLRKLCQKACQMSAPSSHCPSVQFQLLGCVWLFVTPWTAALQASLSITNSQSLLKLMSIELVMPSNHLILCHPLLLPPLIFPSIRVFSNESGLHIRWPKCWSLSLSFSINPSNESSGLISFRMDWLDLLAVQGTLKSLLQHHSSKA